MNSESRLFWLWGWDWCLTELRPLLRAYCSSPDESEWANEWMSERTIFFFFGFRKCGAHGGMIQTGGNRRTRRETCASATLFTTNPTGVTRARTQAAAVRGRRLTAWAMARLNHDWKRTLEIQETCSPSVCADKLNQSNSSVTVLNLKFEG
jgi:hypothetical protein